MKCPDLLFCHFATLGTLGIRRNSFLNEIEYFCFCCHFLIWPSSDICLSVFPFALYLYFLLHLYLYFLLHLYFIFVSYTPNQLDLISLRPDCARIYCSHSYTAPPAALIGAEQNINKFGHKSDKM